MAYIKRFESFRNNKNKINEELLGGLFKSLKNKLSLGFSKMFGSASEIDKIMVEYKKELFNIGEKRIEAIVAYVDHLKGDKKEDKKEEEKLKAMMQKTSKLYERQKEVSKEKFNLKIKEVISNEKNPKIEYYINLKKLELEQEMISSEMEEISNGTGLTEEELSDKYLTEFVSDMKIRKEEADKRAKQEKEKISSKNKEEGEVEKFNFEEAIKKKDNDSYRWEDSKYTKSDYKFEEGDELKYLKKGALKKDQEYRGTTAYVMSYDEQKKDKGGDLNEQEIRVKLNKEKKEDKGFVIDKAKIITTKKDE